MTDCSVPSRSSTGFRRTRGRPTSFSRCRREKDSSFSEPDFRRNFRRKCPIQVDRCVQVAATAMTPPPRTRTTKSSIAVLLSRLSQPIAIRELRLPAIRQRGKKAWFLPRFLPRMGEPRSVSKPAYFRHTHSGQARVRIDGKDHYLGLADSEDSWTRYDALIEEWARRRPVNRATLTIDELCLRLSDRGWQRRNPSGFLLGPARRNPGSARPRFTAADAQGPIFRHSRNRGRSR